MATARRWTCAILLMAVAGCQMVETGPRVVDPDFEP